MKLEQMKADINDVHELQNIESTLEVAVEQLNEAIEEESDYNIILISYMDKHPEIKETLSPKNKILELRRITEYQGVKEGVDNWLRAITKIKMLRNKIKQIEGKRDSIKKIMSIRPN